MMEKLKELGMRLKKVTSNKDFVRKVGNVLVAVAYVMFVVALASEIGFADTNKEGGDIFAGINNLLNEVKGKILTFSTFAVVIGVGIGAFMKKFSMGKQDKIEMGSKLMKDSIIAFVIVNATPRIVNFITSYLGHGSENIVTQ